MADGNPLYNIPGLGGYLAKRQMNDQQPMQELQQASALMQIQGAIQTQQAQAQEQQRNTALRTAIDALPPGQRTRENVMPLILQHANTKEIAPLLKSETDHQDRQDAMRARAEESKGRLALQQQNADMMHEFRMSRLTNDSERAAELARHNKAREEMAAQQATVTAELRRAGLQVQQDRAADQRDKQRNTQTQQLGAALEKANLPEADAVLGAVETHLKKAPEVAEYLSGPKSLLPDALVPQHVREARQAFSKLFNITLKTRSGAAVTNQELERLKQEFATGAFKTAAQLNAAVDQARNIINKHYAAVAGGFHPDALKGYNENVRQFGGRVVLESQGGTAPSGGENDPLGIR